MVHRIFILLLLISGAFTASGCMEEAPPFDVNPTLTTPKGIQVDPSGNEVNLQAIDCIVDRVEKCLIRKFGEKPVIPREAAFAAYCPRTSFSLPIDRKNLVLKIPDEIPTVLNENGNLQPVSKAPGWHLNCAGTQQLLTLSAGDSGCLAKGLTPTDECPCRWRAHTNGLDLNTIIATPSLHLFPDWVIRYTTGCQNPWTPEFAECAATPAGPLDSNPSCVPDET